jgi:hypothetical protein
MREKHFKEFVITLDQGEVEAIGKAMDFLKKFDEYKRVVELIENCFSLGKHSGGHNTSRSISNIIY